MVFSWLSLDGGGALAFSDDLEADLDWEVSDGGWSPSAILLRPEDLKSVSYHPLPLRRNPAWEISFSRECRLQFGHFVNKASSLP